MWAFFRVDKRVDCFEEGSDGNQCWHIFLKESSYVSYDNLLVVTVVLSAR